jgi:DNA helicase-2/ATP-dependent DNA helicase PcrA
MEYLEKLNPQQREAVEHTEGPLLILAGAGSGKTRVLTCRIAYLIEHCGVRPWNIMAITFTNKAAGEMRERVDGLVGMGSEAIWVSTFHSSCCRILRRYIDRIGYDNSFTIYDTDDSRQVMKAVVKELELNPKIYKEKALLGKISAAKNNLVSPDEMEADASRWEEKQTARAYRAYQKRLKKNNALDFDDLLVLAVELFEKAPDVLESYQERFRYILIDEYQDTNTVQFRFVKLLAEKYRNICVVGDDDQSIYKFRGANIMNILNFEKSFPGAKVIKLEQNYRSTQSILDAANEVISNNSGRKEKKLWTDNGRGTRVRFREFQTGYDEAEFVAGEIARKVREENRSYRDYAVLYRTNAQSRLFEEKMIAADIPYKLVGGVNFYARREIKDMLAYLKTVDNGLDDLAVQRIVNVPKRGVGATSLARVQNYALENGISFYEALQEAEKIPGLGRSLGGIRKFTALIGRLRAAGREYLNVREILEMIIRETGYVEELEAEGNRRGQGKDREHQ